MRLVALLTVFAACSTSSRREDSAMPVGTQGSQLSGSGGTTRGPSAGNDSERGSGSSTPAEQPTVFVATPAGELPVSVEVVSTEAAIERGLMYRQHLPPEAGMLFLMPFERAWTFWMRNTLIPLDMIFIGKDLSIAGIVENAEPLTESLRVVDKPSLYVLEVNAGWTRRHGVVAGARIRFAGVAPRAPGR